MPLVCEFSLLSIATINALVLFQETTSLMKLLQGMSENRLVLFLMISNDNYLNLCFFFYYKGI